MTILWRAVRRSGRHPRRAPRLLMPPVTKGLTPEDAGPTRALSCDLSRDLQEVARALLPDVTRDKRRSDERASLRPAASDGREVPTSLASCAARIVTSARTDSLCSLPCCSSMASAPTHPAGVIKGTTRAPLARSVPLTTQV